MNKYILLFLMAFGLISCSEKNEQYYRTNPKALEKALKACPSVQPAGISCQGLEDLAKDMSNLAYELQKNPQGFGSRILNLQDRIANQQNELNTSRSNVELKSSLDKNQNELMDLLTIVKWLESPES